MRSQRQGLLGIKNPPDGFTDEEETIKHLLFENTVHSIYAKLPTSRMKAIVALHCELGYTQEMVAKMFSVTQEQISQEIANVRKILKGKKYRPHKRKPVIEVKDLLNICLSLQRD